MTQFDWMLFQDEQKVLLERRSDVSLRGAYPHERVIGAPWITYRLEDSDLRYPVCRPREYAGSGSEQHKRRREREKSGA